MAFTDEHDLEFQRALRSDPCVDWARWLPDGDDAEAHEIACQLFGIGAEKLGWDFQWIHDSWHRYQDILCGFDDIAVIRDLHGLHCDCLHEEDCECVENPTWEQYEPFGIPAESLRLKNEEKDPADVLYLGEVVGDAYRIEQRISDGGFGLVYRAIRLSDEKTVAIKVPKQGNYQSDCELVFKQIETEARMLQDVAGQGIPVFHELLEHNETPTLVREFIEGRRLLDLPNHTEEEKRVIAAHLADVAEILHRLHARGFVHGDLKPQNILISKNNTPYLIDFGLGFNDERPAEYMLRVAGTRRYMAPEQFEWTWQQRIVDWRCDIWAIGIMLRDFFSGESVPQLSQPGNSPSAAICLNELLQCVEGTEIGKIVRDCLVREEWRRISTGKKLASALRSWMRGEEYQPDRSRAWVDALQMRVATETTTCKHLLDILELKADQARRSGGQWETFAKSISAAAQAGLTALQSMSKSSFAYDLPSKAYSQLENADYRAGRARSSGVFGIKYRSRNLRHLILELREAGREIRDSLADFLWKHEEQVLSQQGYRTRQRYRLATAFRDLIDNPSRNTLDILDTLAYEAEIPERVWKECTRRCHSGAGLRSPMPTRGWNLRDKIRERSKIDTMLSLGGLNKFDLRSKLEALDRSQWFSRPEALDQLGMLNQYEMLSQLSIRIERYLYFEEEPRERGEGVANSGG